MNKLTDDERRALEKAKAYRDCIKRGVTKEALKALKARFGYHLPAFLYATNGFKAVSGNESVELMKLHAAVRDGQREVITYIEQILNNDDE